MALDPNRPFLKDTLIPNHRTSPAIGAAIVRHWKKTKRITNPAQALRIGNMVFVSRYDAETVPVWDINPVILILRVTKAHVLAFNINWLPLADKERMIKEFVKACRPKRPPTRMERYVLFNKIRKKPFPRAAFRVYHRKELESHRLYLLSLGDFWEAITANLITKKTQKV